MREMDLAAIRARLEREEGRSWWRGLEELADSPEVEELLHREFPEQASELTDPASRRTFLKLMGASLGLAGMTACTRMPDERIVPYVRQPEEVIPGRPLFFATAMPFAGGATPLLVESHMGRPTKAEPNPQHPYSGTGTDVFAQASILSLYDPDRSRTIRNLGEIRPWSAFLQAMQGAYRVQRQVAGQGLRLLTGRIVSPTLASQIDALLKELPGAKWHQWDPVAPDNARAGSRLAFGEIVDARYDLRQADVILALDADFLGEGPQHLALARDFASRRRLVGGETTMNRLYAVESTPTPTGLKADHRIAVRASAIEAFARAVAAGVGVAGAGGSATVPGVPDAFVRAVVEDLQAHRGTSLVIVGDEQPPAVHALAHAINAALGNVGTTVAYSAPVEAGATEHLASLRELVDDMNTGTIDLLVMIGTNPVYSAPPDLEFERALEKVGLRVHVGLHEDETAIQCHWHVPETHFLEAWSDARTADGTVSIVQPLIAPLYDSHSPHEILALLSATPSKSGYDWVREFWQRAWEGRSSGAWGPLTSPDGTEFEDFEAFWRRAVHDGFIPGTALPTRQVTLDAGAIGRLEPATPGGSGSLEVTFRADPAVYDGRFANNGWLQELPRPVTKITWDNVALVSPATAQRLGVVSEDVVDLRIGDRLVKAPVWVMPGQADDCVTVNLGYGRWRAGHVGNGVGFNAYLLRTSGAPYIAQGLQLAKNGERYRLASTQLHFSLEGRNHVRAATLETFRAQPDFPHHMGHAPDRAMSLYPEWKYEGYAWGMAIDLNACHGCSACVVACVSENNTPVVGKDQVMRQREMHWLRIDRYYTGSVENPETYFQPMLCQHCENAPCEVVCPVAATTHSSEGLNDMVYNRCVGTRYCSHNCPYKVRRFNFLLYSDWETPSLKMARNPDVTVRSRGVMEKCTFCVQRINHARIDAKREDRQIRDGEIVTACQAACPSEAIVFGNINDPASRVSQLRKEARAYSVLEELNTRPRIEYLAAVRNPNPALEPAQGTSAAPAAHGGAH